MSGTRTSITSVGIRATEVKNLNVLKAPEDGGTKENFENFIEKIERHVAMSWKGGKYINYLPTKLKSLCLRSHRIFQNMIRSLLLS